ncbi:hypothetical protein KA005_31690 [bacterium]|nr:hypothetical protein [bacterium]
MILKAMFAFWMAFGGYWSLIPIVIIMITGAVAWRYAITPREENEKVAWQQARENRTMEMSRPKRYGRMILLIAFSFMATTFFCVSIFMIFSKG